MAVCMVLGGCLRDEGRVGQSLGIEGSTVSNDRFGKIKGPASAVGFRVLRGWRSKQQCRQAHSNWGSSRVRREAEGVLGCDGRCPDRITLPDHL